MKRATQTGLLLALLCCASVTVRADAIGDYKVILERNPFGLKPPPPPPPPATNAPVETPTDYKLTGITALFRPMRAMFVNQPPGKPTPEYVSLSEGQRQGSLEVLADGIDVKAGTVRVKISGEERTLSFAKDGLKAAAGPPVMTAPGVPMPRPGMNPVPPTPGGTTAQPLNNYPGPQQFNRPGPAATQPASIPTTITAPPQLQSTPQRPVRTVPISTSQNQTAPPPAPNVDPVVQTVAIEVNRAATRTQVDAGQLPPLPPTDLTGR